MHAHTVHTITQCNQIIKSKNKEYFFSNDKKIKSQNLISEHITILITMKIITNYMKNPKVKKKLHKVAILW